MHVLMFKNTRDSRFASGTTKYLTAVAALEKDTDIPSIQLYTKVQAHRHALNAD